MIHIEENRKTYVTRLLGCLICFPTVGVMFLDWVRISFLNNLKEKLSFLDFVDSDFTLLEIMDFLKKIEEMVGPQTRKIVISTGVAEILSIASIFILFILLLFGSRSAVKKMGVLSFVLNSTLFFVFMYSINRINSNGTEGSSGDVLHLVEATPWPYVMFACAVLLFIVSVFLVDRKQWDN